MKGQSPFLLRIQEASASSASQEAPHTAKHNYGTCTHLFLKIQVHCQTVVTCQIPLPNATAHNRSHRGTENAAEVPERLKDCIHETCIPQVPKACGTEGSGASLGMRTVKLKTWHCSPTLPRQSCSCYYQQFQSRSNYLTSSNCLEAPS